MLIFKNSYAGDEHSDFKGKRVNDTRVVGKPKQSQYWYTDGSKLEEVCIYLV